MLKNKLNKLSSHRQLRVGENLRRILSDFFRSDCFIDFHINSSTITVTEVSVSPDLRNAIVYIIPLGGRFSDIIINYLNTNVSKIKHYVARNAIMRVHPKLTFCLDTSFDYANNIGNIINTTEVQIDLINSSKDE